MNLDSEALRVAENLSVGVTRRCVCPVCDGGPKKEVTWVVGRESDRVWYKCFRATCPGATGIVGSHTLSPVVQAEKNRALERLNPYTRSIEPLTTDDCQYFQDRFGLDLWDGKWIGQISSTADDEYLLYVRSPDRKVRGHVVRQPVWKGVPKAPRQGRPGYWENDLTTEPGSHWKPMPKTVLYPASTEPMLAWYKANKMPETWHAPHLVVVEDQISAMKVAQCGVNAVALLGNGMNVEIVRDIVRQKPKIVTIALDPGAEGQAQNLAKKWGLYFNRTRVALLEADPKDIPEEDLLSELGL